MPASARLSVPALTPEGSDGAPEKIMIPAIGSGGALFPVEKMEAHRRGLHHLAISIFLFDRGETLIQRRAREKYHSGGQWANACCTHPHWGEDMAGAAARRLREELGASADLSPRRVIDYRADVGRGLIEHERVHFYVAEVNRHALALAPDPAEVSETRWVAPAALRAEIAATPERFTPWLRIYLDRFPDLAL